MILPPAYAERKQPERGGERGPARPPAAHPSAPVERTSHGSIRHVNTPVVAPSKVEMRPISGGRGDVDRHRDVEADIHRPRFWNGFVHGRRWPKRPEGCVPLFVNGAPFFYNDGIFYQLDQDSYVECFPPVGATVAELPDGAVALESGDQAYYYAGGAFYVQQDDGFVIAPTPIGVDVPELPPGAEQVSVGGNIAYQFNGIYFQPVFVNGVTQYQTFAP